MRFWPENVKDVIYENLNYKMNEKLYFLSPYVLCTSLYLSLYFYSFICGILKLIKLTKKVICTNIVKLTNMYE